MNDTYDLNQLIKLNMCIVCTFHGHFIRHLSKLAIEHIAKIKPIEGQS